jgi:hypothetical protein
MRYCMLKLSIFCGVAEPESMPEGWAKELVCTTEGKQER